MAPWHLDDHIPAFPVPAAAELACPRLPAGSRLQRMTRLYQAVADTMAQAARPLLLSGDCTTAIGAVAGLQRRHGDLAVVWLDGHGDFNTPGTTITGYLGGMPLAALTGRAPQLMCGPLQLRPVAERRCQGPRPSRAGCPRRQPAPPCPRRPGRAHRRAGQARPQARLPAR